MSLWLLTDEERIQKLLDKYNGKDFKFDSVDVVSSGEEILMQKV